MPRPRHQEPLTLDNTLLPTIFQFLFVLFLRYLIEYLPNFIIGVLFDRDRLEVAEYFGDPTPTSCLPLIFDTNPLYLFSLLTFLFLSTTIFYRPRK